MPYKCPNCEHTSEEAGLCPTCNVEVKEVASEVSAEPQAEQVVEVSETAATTE